MSIRIGTDGLTAVIKGFTWRIDSNEQKTVKIKLAVQQIGMADLETYFPADRSDSIEPIFDDLPFNKVVVPGTEARLTMSVSGRHPVHGLKVDKLEFKPGPVDMRPEIQSAMIHLSGPVKGNQESLKAMTDYICCEVGVDLEARQGEIPLEPAGQIETAPELEPEPEEPADDPDRNIFWCKNCWALLGENIQMKPTDETNDNWECPRCGQQLKPARNATH